MYKKPLKVRTPDNKQIFAKIYIGQENVQITIDYLKEVEKDKPPFAKKGRISIQVRKTDYTKRDNDGKSVIDRLTNYLESLFFKELANESSHTSHEGVTESGRGVKQYSAGKTSGTTGKGQTSSVYNSARGNKSTETPGGRSSEKVDVAKGTDTKD